MLPKLHRGYTLAELLISICIVLILGLAILIAINPIMQIFKGYDTRRKADLYELKNAFEAYYADHDCYPSTDVLAACGSNALVPYLDKIPCDPQSKKPYNLTLEPAGSTCPQNYALYAQLLNTADPLVQKLPDCPGTMALTSPGMSYVDTVAGCSSVVLCPVYYGCMNGICTAVAHDKKPTCAPNYCDADCGGVNCSKKVRGRYINECNAF